MKKSSFLLLIIFVICIIEFSPAVKADVKNYTLNPQIIFREREDDENYLISGGYGIAVDNTGAFYILDGKEFCVKKYDSSGKFIVKFGNPGQGPGELFQPRDIQFLGDKILVLQFDKLHVFNLDGSLVETRAREFELFDYSEKNIKFYSNWRKYVFTGNDIAEERFFLEIVDKSEKTGRIIESVKTGKTSFSPRKNEMIIIFTMDIFFDVDDRGIVIFAQDGENRDLKIFENGKIQVIHRVKGSPVPLPPDALKKEQMHFKAVRNQGLNYPEKTHYSVITGVFFDGDDIMLRIRTKERTGLLRLSRAGIEEAFYAENDDTAKENHLVIRNNMIYYLINDPDEGVIVKRAKLN